jgi:hypothetical protein
MSEEVEAKDRGNIITYKTTRCRKFEEHNMNNHGQEKLWNFHPEDGGNICLQKVGIDLLDYNVSPSRRQQYEKSPT